VAEKRNDPHTGLEDVWSRGAQIGAQIPVARWAWQL